jgi:hypothetical protein
MNNDILGVKTTFTPLRGKRLRCNQTGEVIKRSKGSSLKRARRASKRNDFRLNIAKD